MTITQYTGNIPNRGQSQLDFNANENAILAYQVGLAAQLNQFADEINAYANVSIYAAATSYQFPNVVICLDGYTYRCISVVAISGDYPPTSNTGYWVRLILSSSDPGVGIPVGSSILWDAPLALAPSSYYARDGRELSRVSYSTLFAIYGTIHGEGDGITTFNIPDNQGEFPRMVDGGSGVDPDAASRTDRGDGTTGDVVGTKQADQFRSHYHSYSARTESDLTYFDGIQYGNGLYQGNTGSKGGNETRPINFYTYYLVRAF